MVTVNVHADDIRLSATIANASSNSNSGLFRTSWPFGKSCRAFGFGLHVKLRLLKCLQVKVITVKCALL